MYVAYFSGFRNVAKWTELRERYCRVNPEKFAFRITNAALRSDRSVLSYGAVET